MIEDHDVLSSEVDELILLVIEANKEDSLYTSGKYTLNIFCKVKD